MMPATAEKDSCRERSKTPGGHPMKIKRPAKNSASRGDDVRRMHKSAAPAASMQAARTREKGAPPR